jgi:hypothetical protein
MKKFATVVWVCILLVVLGFRGNANAAAITPGVWSPVIHTDINNDNNPYWDGESYDGGECGIGWLLTSGSCSYAVSHGLYGLEYLHDGAGAPASFTFTNPVQTGFAFFAEVTDWAADGALDWYDASNQSSTGVIFTGADGPGAHADPELPAIWGLKFTSRDGVYFSGDNTLGQFALFRQNFDDEVFYYLGVEDISNNSGSHVSDRDNNDVGIGFSQPNPANVPEPGSITLLALGVLFGANRLRQRTRS